MSAPRQILKNIGALTAARGVTAVLTLATMVYLARVLEPGAFGVLSWALAYFAYFKLLPDLGLGVYGQREIARDHAVLPELVGRILTLRVAMGAVALLLYLGPLFLLDKPPLFKAVVAMQGLGLLGFAVTLEWAYKGVERMGVLAVRNVAVAVLTFLGVLLFVRRPDQVVLASAATVFGTMGGNLWLLVTYRREYGPLRPRGGWGTWRAMLAPALPIGIAHFLVTINVNMDQLMLGLIRTEQEVGWYAAAYRLLWAAMIPAQIILQAFLPSLSASFGDKTAMRRRARPFASALFACGFPLAAGGALLAPDLIGLFGKEYAPAVPAFLLLMAYTAVQYTSTAFGNALVAWDRQRRYMAALLGGALVNVGLNVALIPRLGIVGAATATLCSEVAVCLGVASFHYMEVQELYLGPLGRALGATLLASAGMLLLRMWLDLPLLLAAAVMGGLYLGAAQLTGVVDLHRMIGLARERTA